MSADFSLARTQTCTRVSIWIVEGISHTLYSVCVCECAHLHTRAHAHAHRLTHNACAHASCISSPRIRIYQPESLDEDLQLAAIEYLMANSPKNRLSRQNSGNGSHSLLTHPLCLALSISHSHCCYKFSIRLSVRLSHALTPTLCTFTLLYFYVSLSLVCESPCVLYRPCVSFFPFLEFPCLSPSCSSLNEAGIHVD